MKTLFACAAGIAVGYGLSFLTIDFKPPAKNPSSCTIDAPATPRHENLTNHGLATPSSQHDAQVGHSAGNADSVIELARCEEDLSQTRKQATDCYLQRRADLANLQHEQGYPMAFPQSLDKKFRQEALISALSAAFKETGVRGHVQVADCDEYPCIACGNLGDDVPRTDVTARIADTHAVAGAKALQTYADATATGSVFTYPVADTQLERTLFCQAFYPKPDDEAQAEQIKRRVAYRIAQLEKSLH